MPSIPHATGKDATLSLFIAGSPVASLDVKSWNVKRNITKIEDGVNGEDRDRLDAITNFFELDFEMFNQKTADKMTTLLAEQANDDANAAPTDKQVAFILRPRDGSKEGYLAKGVCLDDWSMGAGGRTERIMTKLPMRAQYFDKASV